MKPARLATFILVAVPLAFGAVPLAPGVVLVADRHLEDPHFAKTVILIADHGEDGTLGLILNRRTDMALGEVLEQWKEATGVKDPIFVGGPVSRSGMFALIRIKTPPEGAKRVISDIHLITDRTGLAPHIKEGPARVRVYAGYTGWGPDQLESEIDDGGWHVLPANPNIVFDEDPNTLWVRLGRIAEQEVASRRLPAQPAHKTNLYPTPWTVIKCLGSPASSFARIPAM
jgi:putative transcriptional regulator